LLLPAAAYCYLSLQHPSTVTAFASVASSCSAASAPVVAQSQIPHGGVAGTKNERSFIGQKHEMQREEMHGGRAMVTPVRLWLTLFACCVVPLLAVVFQL